MEQSLQTSIRLFGKALGLALLGALLLGRSSQAAEPPTEVAQGVVIRNATVVNTHDGSLSGRMTLVISDGKIQAITAAPVRVVGAAQTVDASGKYVVPGFMDMHAHAVETADLQPSYFPLMIASGITGFREESVSPAFVARGAQVNADRAAGRLDAPEVVFSGAEAHLNPAVSALASSNAGWPSMDHLGAGVGLILDCSTEEDSVRAAALARGFKPPFPPNYVLNPRAFDGAQNAEFYQRILDTYSEPKCVALMQAFVRNHTWQTVTLIRLRTQDRGDDPLYRNDPNLKYLDRKRVAMWDSVGDQFAKLPPSAVATLQKYYGLQKAVTVLMQKNGVKILAGSDTGGVWVIPGFGLHQEFHELAASGLSPLQVLQATTLNAAEFLHRDASAGTVEAGKDADLVLLDANPIVDVAALDKISGVVLRGKYFSKAGLDKLKSDVAVAYK
jgi:hypothetical protein